MKVPPLVINLKEIEKHEKQKKHKKHKKHKHKHHHRHHCNSHQDVEIKMHVEPPILEPVEPIDVVIPPTLIQVHFEEQSVSTVEEPATTSVEEPAKALLEETADAPEEPTQAPEEKSQPSGPKISYLKEDEDSVRLRILAPRLEPEDANEKILNLEQLCGELYGGIDVIPAPLIDNQNDVKPVVCVKPTEFGSYLPTQDSTFANITKDDSETLFEVYGSNEICNEYALSLQKYAKGTNYLMTMVDSLLDILTDGKHRAEVVPIRDKLEKDKSRSEEASSIERPVSMPPQESVKTAEDTEQEQTLPEPQQPQPVADLKIEESKSEEKPEEVHKDETSIDNHKDEAKSEEDIKKDPPESDKMNESADQPDVQQELDNIDELLAKLRNLQERRLSSSSAPIEPDQEECTLADQVLGKMTKLIKEKAKPGDICSDQSIFKALGITDVASLNE